MSPDRLRKLARREITRLSDHISQRQLEKLLGLSQGYLSRLKAMSRNPSTELVCFLWLIAKDPKKRLHELRELWAESAVADDHVTK